MFYYYFVVLTVQSSLRFDQVRRWNYCWRFSRNGPFPIGWRISSSQCRHGTRRCLGIHLRKDRGIQQIKFKRRSRSCQQFLLEMVWSADSVGIIPYYRRPIYTQVKCVLLHCWFLPNLFYPRSHCCPHTRRTSQKFNKVLPSLGSLLFLLHFPT